MPQGPDIVVIEAVPEALQVTFEGVPGTVQGPSCIPIRPPQNDSKHPGLSPTVTAVLRPLSMVQNRQPLPPGPIGDLGGQSPTVTFSLCRRLTEGVEQAGDASGAGRSIGSRDVDHDGQWYDSRKSRRRQARLTATKETRRTDAEVPQE